MIAGALRGLGLDRRVLLAFAVSRALTVGAAVVAENLLPGNPALTRGDDAAILRSLTSWDGWFYLGIVRDGYHAEAVTGTYQDVAFLPLFPMVVRVLSAPWPQLAGLVAVLVANLACLVALGLLVRLGERHLGRDKAALAASLLVIYPFAVPFAMAYTESLFLLVMVAAFLAAETRHRAWAGVFLGLAAICRFQGVVLILPVWLVLLRQDGWRPRPSHAWLLLGPAAAAGFLLEVAAITGSPTGYFDALQAWGRKGIAGSAPQETIAAGFSPYQGALLATLCWSVFMLVWVRRDRIRPEYALVPVLFIAAVLSSGTLESVGRVTMLAFPFAWLLAGRRSVLARRVWPVLSAGLFTLVAVLTFTGFWVP